MPLRVQLVQLLVARAAAAVALRPPLLPLLLLLLRHAAVLSSAASTRSALVAQRLVHAFRACARRPLRRAQQLARATLHLADGVRSRAPHVVAERSASAVASPTRHAARAANASRATAAGHRVRAMRRRLEAAAKTGWMIILIAGVSPSAADAPFRRVTAFRQMKPVVRAILSRGRGVVGLNDAIRVCRVAVVCRVELRDNTNVGPVDCAAALPIGRRAARLLGSGSLLQELLQHSRPLLLLLLRLLDRPPDAERRERPGLPAALLTVIARDRLPGARVVWRRALLLARVLVRIRALQQEHLEVVLIVAAASAIAANRLQSETCAKRPDFPEAGGNAVPQENALELASVTRIRAEQN